MPRTRIFTDWCPPPKRERYCVTIWHYQQLSVRNIIRDGIVTLQSVIDKTVKRFCDAIIIKCNKCRKVRPLETVARATILTGSVGGSTWGYQSLPHLHSSRACSMANSVQAVGVGGDLTRKNCFKSQRWLSKTN